jgi:hypothetical protein
MRSAIAATRATIIGTLRIRLTTGLITVHLPYVFKIVFIAIGKQSANDAADVNRFFPVNQVFSTEFACRKKSFCRFDE